MRPDEHKKKKNTEYKKKHGISAKKESKKEEIKKDKSEKPQDTKEKEETSRNTETRSFSRRKVTSNWDRYEDLEDEPDDAYQTKGRRGADFASLLERTGDSHSQFRFQAEKEWEDDLVGTQETQDVLKINFEDLSQSLSSLPLYKKLDLKEKEIYTEQHEGDKDERDTIKEMLKCIDIHDGLENIDVNKQRSNFSLNQQSESLSNFLTSGAESSKTQENKKVASNLRQSIKDLADETPQGLNTSAVTGTLYSMGVIKKTDRLDDEELDFLLSLEPGQHQKNSIETPLIDKEVPSVPPQMNSKNPDTQTTTTAAAILASDKNLVSQGPSAMKSETPSDDQKPKEDLEDWLDSVLG